MIHFSLKFQDESAMLKPLKVRKARTYLVSDLFHENVKDEWIDKVFAVMALCPQHTFQILTKRPERMREYFQYKTEPDFSGWRSGRIDLIGKQIYEMFGIIPVGDSFGANNEDRVFIGELPFPNVHINEFPEEVTP